MIRPFGPADAPGWVALWNEVLERKRTTEQLLADLQRDAGASRLWVVTSRTDEGELSGLALLSPSPFTPPGFLQAWVVVAPAARAQGLGERLWQTLLSSARETGAAGLTAEVADTDLHSLAWAEKRGFAVQLQRFASELDLTTFDPAPFAADLARAGAQDVTFRDLRGASGVDMQAYLNFVADRLTETPDLAGHPRWSLEEVAKLLHLGRDDTRPDWLILAVSPDGNWLGTTAMVNYGDMAYNEFTTTHPQARGRGLALPLKLQAIARAQAAGLKVMRTNNHSRNAPMLAVNRRLGFVPQAGKYELHLSF